MLAATGLDVELRELLTPTQTRVTGELESLSDYWLSTLGTSPVDGGCTTGLCRGALTRVSEFAVRTDRSTGRLCER